MSPGLIWMMGGIAICGAELLMPGAFLLWIGLAAIGAGVAASVVDLAFTHQVWAFLALLAGLLCVPLARRRLRPPDPVNAPEAGLIGKTCRALAFNGAEGRVTFRDGVWPARSTGPTPQPGETLRVTGLDGTTLLVAPSGGAG